MNPSWLIFTLNRVFCFCRGESEEFGYTFVTLCPLNKEDPRLQINWTYILFSWHWLHICNCFKYYICLWEFFSCYSNSFLVIYTWYLSFLYILKISFYLSFLWLLQSTWTYCPSSGNYLLICKKDIKLLNNY